MSSDNRARIDVIQPGAPRLYQNADLPGWEVVGEVHRGSERGALVRRRNTGEYSMARAGALSSLDQRKVKAALGIHPGRPNEMEGGGRRNVYLDAESMETARRAGNGNISEGVRVALRAYAASSRF